MTFEVCFFRQTCLCQEALIEISKVVKEDPDSSKAILVKAEILYEMGLFEKAMVEHFKGMRTNPRFENNAFQSRIG